MAFNENKQNQNRLNMFKVGQNVWWIGGASLQSTNFAVAVQDWYDEVALFDSSNIDSYTYICMTFLMNKDKMIKPPIYYYLLSNDTFAHFHSRFDFNTGHYTQVVWADTEEVGCGVVYFQVSSYFTKNDY